jgi:NAD(P)-dependent dehydrogenase (short-subunit alcohol dehydrogenase family)
MRLKGKVAIITGGAQGIGLATTRKFLAEGARVALADVRAGAVDTALRELNVNGAAAGYTVDVTRREAVDGMVAQGA